MERPLVCVSGAFDKLHTGHIELLTYAETFKGLTGNLIVLLNSNDYVIAKGHSDQNSDWYIRAEKLLKYKCINGILKIDNDPTSILELLKPDFFVVGSDYKIEDIKGLEFIKTLVITPRPKDGPSSTKIAKQFKN